MSEVQPSLSFQISGLHPDVNVREAFQTLNAIGRVSHFRMAENGVVVVQYYSKAEAALAAIILHDSMVLRAFVTITWTIDDIRDPIKAFFVENLDPNINNDGLEIIFQPYGYILCCLVDYDNQGNSLGNGHVYYKKCEIKDVLDGVCGKSVNFRTLGVTYLEPPVSEIEEIPPIQEISI